MFRILNLAIVFIMTFGSPLAVFADPSPTGATIASDQADYPPGGTVILTGLGWFPDEVVSIFVNDDAGQTWSLNASASAGADGSFIYQFQLPSWFVANYSVTASGGLSGTATTSFTDLSIGTYDQCSNDDGDGYATGDDGCRWINGNLQSNNSIYFEGDATVQRVWLTGFIPGSTHTVTLKYGTTKGGKHAYDFLTTWDWSENWITLADRCQGITGCTNAGETYLDIPQDPNVPDSFEPSDAGDRQFVMRGGTLNSATTPVIVSGNYAGDSETVVTVSFTVASSGDMCPTAGSDSGTCGVALWFGAHVAAQANWGLGQGAGSIPGSPYHVALDAVDSASVGQRDNQMQANAVTVIPNGTIVIVKDAVPNDAQDFSFNLNNGSTISQNFSLDDDAEATLLNSQTFSVPPGIWSASELNIPSGWTLTNLVCVDPTSNTTVDLGTASATINLASNETVTCTFTDSKAYNQNLTVSKTATPSYGRSYSWDIYKNVDKTQANIAEGGEATFKYTVGVTHDSGTDSGFTVSGVITVSNPNSFAIAGVDISDAIDNGGTCSVTDGEDVTVPANGNVNRNYSCSFSSNPGTGTNTATATWDANAYFTPSGTANGTAGYNFASATPAISNGTVNVTDTLGGNLGSVSYTDPSPVEFTYSKTFPGVAGTCTDYDNTATITETGQSASQTVTVCVGKDLTVSKTASGTFGRQYFWSISKNADATDVSIAEGGSYTFQYTVDVNQTGFTDNGWEVYGTITISNPNDWQAITLTDLSDAVNNGGACTVDAGPYVVPASGSLDVNYSCSFASEPDSYSGKNTATATWDAAAAFTPSGSASGEADFTLSQSGGTNKTITVEDSYAGDLGTVTATDSEPFASASFTYDRTESGVAGTCTTYDNTATITETGQSADESVELCVGSDLTVSKTAAGTFGRTYLWEISKNADATEVSIAEGGSYTFHYTVNVNQTGFSDSGWTLSGVITISNPNDWQDIILTDLSDAVDNGGTCTVDAGPYLVPADGSLNVNYSCSFASKPGSYSGTNTATAAWDAAAAFTPSGSASGDAGFTLSQSGGTNQTVNVTDSYASDLGSLTATDGEPFASASFTYDRTESGVAGTCTTYDNTATITQTNQSADESVELCVGSDLTVSKTATGTFDREYFWSISKNADATDVSIAEGGSYTFHYTVDVAQTGFSDSGWEVHGTITVSNPNDWQAITLTSLSDVVNNGGACTVVAGPYLVPADGSLDVNYSCSFASGPGSYSGTNTATAAWDAAAAFTPSGSASGDAGFTLTKDQTTNETVNVTDSYAGSLGTVTATDSAPFASASFTYDRTESGVAGTCTTYDNTATITQTNQSADESVELCVGSDLTVSKTATGTFDREYFWSISKNADQTQVFLAGANPQSYTFTYTVDVNQTGFSDSGWEVHGVITVSNPNDWQAITLTSLSDAVDNGGACTVVAGPYVVPADGSLDVSYSCSFASEPDSYSGTNTATAAWDAEAAFTPNGSASGDADFTLAKDQTTNETVNVTDSYAGDLGSLAATDGEPFASASFTYDRTESSEPGTCSSYDNTATITETGQSADETVTVCSSLLNVIKLTEGVVDPSQEWKFSLFNGPHATDPFSAFGAALTTDTSKNKAGGILDFGEYNLDPAFTYTFCETNAPAGWSSQWKYNETLITPYNPDRFPTSSYPNGQDLGNRCFDFGAGTSYPIPEGGTITFQVDNRFPGGEPRTIGFWKNWNTCTGGQQQYTATKNAGYDGNPTDPAAGLARVTEGWFLLDDVLNDPGITIGNFIIPDANVTFSKTIGKTTVTKTGCQIATDLLGKSNWFTGRQAASDAAYGLAAQLIAAKANLTAGAETCTAITSAVTAADTLLASINFDGTASYLDSKVKGSLLTTRNQAISLADTIDKYNNGVLCP